MFVTLARTHERTGQKHNPSGHTTLGGDIHTHNDLILESRKYTLEAIASTEQ